MRAFLRGTRHRGRIGDRRRRVGWGLSLGAAAALLLAGAAAAEAGWVRGAPLNLRTGPGEQYRIIATMQPGTRLQILQHAEDWTQVQDDQGHQGWMRAGYLEPKPPPMLQVSQLGDQVQKLQAELDATKKQASDLQSRTATLSSQDTEQRNKLEQLTRENFRLRAGQRWVEWLTGALILGTGMALGAILASLGGRRRRPRLKL